MLNKNLNAKLNAKLKALARSIMIMVPVFSLLTGCAEMNSKFDCPMGSGVMCRSISDVNAMVDGGGISTTYSKQKNKNNTRSTSGKSSNAVSLPTSTTVNHGVYEGAYEEPAKQSDTVMRVWIAPYLDHDGNYNQQNFVYATVKKGQLVTNNNPTAPEKTETKKL